MYSYHQKAIAVKRRNDATEERQIADYGGDGEIWETQDMHLHRKI